MTVLVLVVGLLLMYAAITNKAGGIFRALLEG